MHQQFSGSGKLLGQWLFWLFLLFSKDSAKNGPKGKKGDRKIKNDDTKTGITQVLIELQQNFFHQHWAQKWTTTVNFEYVPFLLNTKFSKIVQNCLSLIRDYLLSKCQQSWAIFGKERAQKSPQKGPFHRCCITIKKLKIYNLAITNDTLIRYTAVV